MPQFLVNRLTGSAAGARPEALHVLPEYFWIVRPFDIVAVDADAGAGCLTLTAAPGSFTQVHKDEPERVTLFAHQESSTGGWQVLSRAARVSTLPAEAEFPLDPGVALGRLQLVIGFTPGPATAELVLAEIGGSFAAGNLARVPDAAAFAIDELNLGIHFIANPNDGQYGNARSWIGQSGDPGFAGISLGGLRTVSSIAFGRDNQEVPQFNDRHLGTYTLQYTQADSPGVATPGCDWVTIGRVTYDPVLCPPNPWMRHRFNFPPVEATAVRILVPGTGLAEGTAIDELEVYQAPGEVTAAPCAPQSAAFHRGDPNSSGTTNITDGIAIFGFLFLGNPATLSCRESADANNDGTINITDGIYLLSWLFTGGPEPAAPGPAAKPCGFDTDPPGSPGDLGCDAYAACN